MNTTPPVADQRPHHPYGPSTLQSIEACPCYQSKQSETPHPRTIIGTLSHGVTETGEDNPLLTDEDVDKAAECIDFYEGRKRLMVDARNKAVQQVLVGHWGKFCAPGEDADAERHAEATVPQIIEIKETYLRVDDLRIAEAPAGVYGDGSPRTVEATTAGYIDCGIIAYCGTYAEIMDWKFGLWPVEQAENNLQGIAYALGMFKHYPNLETVRYFFKQPNLDYVTDATIKRADIPAHYLRLQVVVAKARQARAWPDFSTARAMVPACNFCAHIARCPVVTRLACKVGSKFHPAEIPSDITPSMVHNPIDTKLGLQLAAVLEVWAKAFKNVITNRILCEGNEPPDGYTLESRSPREIVDATKYREVALKYLTEVQFNSTLKATFGSVEKLISDSAPRGSKKAKVEEFGQDAESSGAVGRKDSYVFLRAVPKKPNT